MHAVCSQLYIALSNFDCASLEGVVYEGLQLICVMVGDEFGHLWI